MTWQGVPWFVEGGLHPPEVERLLAYAATKGVVGVVTSADLKVRQTSTPGGSVRVLPGGAIIPNRKTGAGQQSYIARNPSDDTVVVPATAGAARSDLVIARIEDPQYPGTAEPPDPQAGPYIFTRIITDVPNTTTDISQVAGHENDSAITLARIDRPAATANVLDAHITDLRPLSTPRQERKLLTAKPAANRVSQATAAGGEVWPTEGEWSIFVPSWATKVTIVATFGQVSYPAGNVTGTIWARLGAVGDAAAIVTQTTAYDTPGSNQSARASLVVGDTVTIPAGLRGRTVPLQTRAQLGSIISGGSAARIALDAKSIVVVDVQFLEATE